MWQGIGGRGGSGIGSWVRLGNGTSASGAATASEAGVWPTGEPCYAMKLVTGRSLDDVIAAAKTLEKRLALLPNVLRTANTMASAGA